jgi:hypothetical protein
MKSLNILLDELITAVQDYDCTDLEWKLHVDRIKKEILNKEVLDNDLESMTHNELRSELRKLRAGIRQHRDRSGHELCWYSPELWDLLPEKVSVKPEVPPTEEFLDQCRVFRKSLDK